MRWRLAGLGFFGAGRSAERPDGLGASGRAGPLWCMNSSSYLPRRASLEMGSISDTVRFPLPFESSPFVMLLDVVDAEGGGRREKREEEAEAEEEGAGNLEKRFEEGLGDSVLDGRFGRGGIRIK